VSYEVTDSDYNKATAQRVVSVGYVIDGNYAVEAYDFKATKDEVSAAAAQGAAGIESLVKAASFARAWQVDWSDPANIAVSPVAPVVKDYAGFGAVAPAYPHSFAPIVIGVAAAAPLAGDPTVSVTGTVVDKDVIARGPDTGDDKYDVAGNHITIFPGDANTYRGTSDAAKVALITAMAAEGTKASGDGTKSGGAGFAYVDVLSNTLDATAPAQPGDVYKVVLYPKGVPGAPAAPAVSIELTVTISAGHSPVIDFTRIPLVVARTDAPHTMTDAELKQYALATDVEDMATGWPTKLDAEVLNDYGQPSAQGIDSSKTGVYKVRYTATDQHNNVTVAYRAVVVDDGRYLIDAQEGIVIGARDFVVRAAGVVADVSAVRSLSYAEAYLSDGTDVGSGLYLPQGIPAAYAAATLGDHAFAWQVTGYQAAKAVTGTVVDATVVVPPSTKDGRYTLVASDFSVNTTDAAAMIALGEPAFVQAAKVRVLPLVPGIAPAVPRMANTGGFAAVAGAYDVTFTIDGIAPAQNGTIKATASLSSKCNTASRTVLHGKQSPNTKAGHPPAVKMGHCRQGKPL
jgi:hypothetical protein